MEEYTDLEQMMSLYSDDIGDESFVDESFVSVNQEDVDLEDSIVPPEVIQRMRESPPYIDEMLHKIDEMEQYAQTRGSMGLDFGIESLNTAFNGLNPGLTLFAGGANTGK